MSLEDFWVNVRSACKRFNSGFDIDRPHLGREEILENLRKDDFWFRKQSVAGFNEADFAFLNESERAELSEHVKELRRLVPDEPTKTPPTPEVKEVKEEAMGFFADIIEKLEFGRFGNAEGLRLGKLIERELGPLPLPGVADLRFDAGVDHSGDPALWIWVFIDRDNSRTDEEFLEKAREVQEIIDPVARSVCGDRWPYFRMLSVDDDGKSATVEVTPPKSEAHQ